MTRQVDKSYFCPADAVTFLVGRRAVGQSDTILQDFGTPEQDTVSLAGHRKGVAINLQKLSDPFAGFGIADRSLIGFPDSVVAFLVSPGSVRDLFEFFGTHVDPAIVRYSQFVYTQYSPEPH